MKIMQVNCVYRTGSTGKIVYDIHNGLCDKGIDSVVCYGRGSAESSKENGVYKTCSELYADVNHLFSRINGIVYGGCAFSTKKLISIIKAEKPDIVHLHCINGYFVNVYSLLKWLGQNHIKTLITMHAEFFYTGGCGHTYDCEKWLNDNGCGNCPRFKTETESLVFDRTKTMWHKMNKAFTYFEKNNLVVASVSPWLMNRGKQSFILKDKNHTTVLNGTDTENVFVPSDFSELKKQLNIKDEKVVLYVTPYFNTAPNHNKGGYYVTKLAEKMVDEPVKFIVVGKSDEANNKFPSNIIFVGRVSDQQTLAQYYTMADVTLLTSKRETFSMICAESLACGTPVVGFKAGASEGISIKEYSDFVDYGDLEKLQVAIKKRLSQPKPDNIHDEAKIKYSRDNMVENYIKLYKSML